MARKKTATCQSCGGLRWDNPNSQTGMCRPCWLKHSKSQRLCKFPGCDEPHHGKGLCRAHYYRPPESLSRESGDPTPAPSPHETSESLGDIAPGSGDGLLPRRAPRDADAVWRCGHPKTPENTYNPPSKAHLPNYEGRCLECKRAYNRAWAAAKRRGGSLPKPKVWRCGHPRAEEDVQCQTCQRERMRSIHDRNKARRVDLLRVLPR